MVSQEIIPSLPGSYYLYRAFGPALAQLADLSHSACSHSRTFGGEGRDNKFDLARIRTRVVRIAESWCTYSTTGRLKYYPSRLSRFDITTRAIMLPAAWYKIYLPDHPLLAPWPATLLDHRASLSIQMTEASKQYKRAALRSS